MRFFVKEEQERKNKNKGNIERSRPKQESSPREADRHEETYAIKAESFRLRDSHVAVECGSRRHIIEVIK